MKPTTFLEIMSVQRHDFLNHLQVIAGLVQLNRGDRVKEYINQVSRDMMMLSKVNHLAAPEVAKTLLIGYYRARKHEVEVLFDVATQLDDCGMTGDVLAQWLKGLFDYSLKCLSPPDHTERLLTVAVCGNGQGQAFAITFSYRCPQPVKAARIELADMEKEITARGGQLKIEESADNTEICVIFS